MSDKIFSEEFILGAGIGALGREELIKLACDLCLAVVKSEGEYHGNIHPGNVSRTADGQVGLGPRAAHEPGEWTTDELEYMAPELFWNGGGDATVDVYSIGLMLYSGICGGRLPFFKKAPGEMTNELRAAALRSRMNGGDIVMPEFAGENLGEVMKKALAFAPEDRWTGPMEMLSALEKCEGEGDALAMEMFGKAERELSATERMMAGIIAAPVEPEEEEPEVVAPVEEEPQQEEEVSPVVPIIPVVKVERPQPTGPKPEYKVDKGFEERNPQPKKKKSNKKPVMIVFGICAVVIILALVIHAFWGGEPGETPTPDPPGSSTPDNSIVDPIDPSGDPTADPSGDPDPDDSTDPTTEPTPEPVDPTATPEPTPELESTYELYISDLSWTEAAAKCKELGGHLVTISDADELSKVTALADTYGIKLIWVGFSRDADGNIGWENDESINYYIWGKGEPSKLDTDGATENYGLLWKKSGEGWIYNDSRNNPVADYPNAYSGKIAYICEYDPE